MPSEIIIFGDSIAYGLFHGEEALSWADLLKCKIGKDSNRRVFNLSIPWEDTTGLLERFDAETSSRGRDQIIFAIGINDAKQMVENGSQVLPIPEFVRNITMIIRMAKRYTTNLVWIGLTPVAETLEENMRKMGYPWVYSNSTISLYDQAIWELCESLGVRYISMKDCLLESDLFDGLHPDGEGQKKMFERIIREL